MPRRFDVAVAGSGPAGAACALRLSRLGFAVALIDERAFPRPKLCGEYLNLGAVRELRELGMGPVLVSEGAPLRGMRLFAHGEIAEFAFSSAAYSVSREILDERIRSAALDSGAQGIAGRLQTVARSDFGVEITVLQPPGETLEISSRYLVGADGMRSTVARLCKLARPAGEGRFAVGGHYAGLDLCDWIEMYASDGGYVALNPLSGDVANAVFVLSREHLMRARNDLAGELERFSVTSTGGRRSVEDDGLQGKRNSIGPISQRTSRPACRNVLLVGDAAAFVDPFTGQGVYLALAGARHAAASISRALHHAVEERSAWRDYAAEIRAAVTERRRLAAMVKMLITFGFAARRAAAALRRRPADFVPLIEAVCGNRPAPGRPELAFTIARALR
ncbi:MAG: NAD(P)/FAD-dependent oxidoreductase [Vulcanimicrobiaceae bacterium]